MGLAVSERKGKRPWEAPLNALTACHTEENPRAALARAPQQLRALELIGDTASIDGTSSRRDIHGDTAGTQQNALCKK